MVERILWRHSAELVSRGIAKRPTGCRQNQPANFMTLSGSKTLIDRAVLAVDGYDARAGPDGCLAEQFSGEDHRFLVGEGNGLPGLHGGPRGKKAGSADSTGHHDIDF